MHLGRYISPTAIRKVDRAHDSSCRVNWCSLSSSLASNLFSSELSYIDLSHWSHPSLCLAYVWVNVYLFKTIVTIFLWLFIISTFSVVFMYNELNYSQHVFKIVLFFSLLIESLDLKILVLQYVFPGWPIVTHRLSLSNTVFFFFFIVTGAS